MRMHTNFLILDSVQPKTEKNSPKSTQSTCERQRKTLHLDYLLENIPVDSRTKVPIIKPYTATDRLPQRMVAFHDAIKKGQTDYDAIVHFYEYDFLFIRLFCDPDKYISTLRQFRYVLSPDMSQYIEMPYYARYANNCHNKALARYMQERGVNIIANVTWSLPDSYDYCFDGIPTNTTIAIGSNGVNAHSDSKYLWKKGYQEALRRLNPTRIIRYGQKMDNEWEDISIYFENQYLRRMRHGS